MTDRHWADPSEDTAVGGLYALADLGERGGALAHRTGGAGRQGFGQPLHGQDVCPQAEQTRAQLVMELRGDLPALVVLNGHEAAVEPGVIRSRGVQRAGQGVEAIHNVCELAHLRAREPMSEPAVL